MIIDGPNTIDLAVGTDRRIVEAGDAQLSLPSTLLPVLLNLRAHIPNPPAGTVQNQSGIYRGTVSRTNQAAIQQNLATLAKGLWELEMVMSSLFTAFIAAAGTLTGNAILLNYGAVDVPLLRRIASTGSWVDYNRMRILVVSNVTLAIEVGVTGVGQSADADVTVNCIRVL